MLIKYFPLLLLALSACSLLAPQRNSGSSKATDSSLVKNYADSPYWISMMDDTHAHYESVRKAFYDYWKGRATPVREENEAKNIYSSRADSSDLNRPTEYVFEYKRFKNWERYYQDLLDEQGYILSQERIIAEWKKQQEANKK